MGLRSFLSAVLKDSPAAADVHVSSTGGGGKKTRRFAAIVSQNTKLPVTKPTAAALAEDPDLGGSPLEKVSHADLAQIIHDCTAALGARCTPGDDGDGDEGSDPDEALKGAPWAIPFKIAKADADQHLIFGWASVVEKGGQLIIDKQGDYILPADLEDAAYDFVLHSRDHGHMHVAKGTGRLVESMVFTTEKQAALGINLGKVGWWCGFKVDDPEVWAAHKRGELPEFSIGGTGKREEA